MELMMPNISTLEETETTGKFVVEPLERGYGVTLGNSLRRVMLSSIEGAAVTYVKIDKVLHEFSIIPGVKEDTTELLLNLKDLYVKVERNGGGKPEPLTIRIAKKGEGRITGADVECPPDVEVVNPEAYIATISDEDATLNMELTVEIGKGYVLPDKQERRATQPIGVIPVGSAFTPVRKVNYTVEATRVGFKTDYERLILDITTNGTIAPSTAISQAAAILGQYFRKFMEFSGAPLAAREVEQGQVDVALAPAREAARQVRRLLRGGRLVGERRESLSRQVLHGEQTGKLRGELRGTSSGSARRRAARARRERDRPPGARGASGASPAP